MSRWLSGTATRGGGAAVAAVAAVEGTRALKRQAQLWDVIVVGGRDRLVSGAARLAGLHMAFKGEMVRLFARVPRVDGLCSWPKSPGIFISYHMDGKMAAQSRWVMVVATRGDATTS
jgi:hypothetical protein